MFESFMPELSSLNVQVPVSYIVTAAAVMFGTYWAVSKLFAMAKLVFAFVFTRFSLAMLGSGALFMTGLAGVGNSTSNIVSAPEKSSSAYIDKKTIDQTITSMFPDSSVKKMAFDYAKEQDAKAATQFVSTNSDIPVKNNKTSYWTMFTTSLGAIVVSIVWTLRRWHEVA